MHTCTSAGGPVSIHRHCLISQRAASPSGKGIQDFPQISEWVQWGIVSSSFTTTWGVTLRFELCATQRSLHRQLSLRQVTKIPFTTCSLPCLSQPTSIPLRYPYTAKQTIHPLILPQGQLLEGPMWAAPRLSLKSA